MPASSHHPEYDEYIDVYCKIRNVVKGDVRQYIPDIDLKDPSRNKRRRDDAVFTNFTSRTRHGLVGAIFTKDPEIDLPPHLEYLRQDSTGTGVPLKKLLKEETGEVIQNARYGVLVDVPFNDTAPVKANSKNALPRLTAYSAESIINWSEDVVNGKYQPILITLYEPVCGLSDDGFKWSSSYQLRVLKLDSDGYYQEIYDSNDKLIEEIVPLDSNGKQLEYIPFICIGSEDNDLQVDPPLLRDIADLNIGHYNNSAEYEESIRLVGCPTVAITSDLSRSHWENLYPNGIKMGSAYGIYLGTQGGLQLVQPAPNQLADEAMKRKEQQAVMLGARLITSSQLNETATAAMLRHSGEHSILSGIVDNVNDANLKLLSICNRFILGEESEDNITVLISKQFFEFNADPQIIMASIQLYDRGLIANSDIRHYIRKTGVIKADRTDLDIDTEVSTANPITGNLDGDN